LGELDMKAAAVDIRQYFQPLFGTPPWRVKPGVGSFLTFEFGPRIKVDGHVHGRWHLWIYLSNWALFRGDRQLVDSDADRKLITISTRRLEGELLTNIDFNARTKKTTFSFGDFRLVVSPADYLDSPGERDRYWIFFMPDNEVLAVGPFGIHVEQGNGGHPSAGGKKPRTEISNISPNRIVRLQD
jgi:hypothetical protein